MPRRRGILSDSERDGLITAAAELCAERGYAEIDGEAIATRAGLTAAVFDRHFESEEECLTAAENAILLEVVAAVSRSYSADRSEWENVIHGVKEILELMAANPEFAYLGYIFSRQMAPGSVREINETGHRMLEAMLQRGWDYSDCPDQPARAALGVLGGAQAIVRRELVQGRAQRLPSILPDCVYVATIPFLGQREAVRLAEQARELTRDGDPR